MNLDDFKNAWKCQNKTDFAKLKPDELVQHLKTEQRMFSRALFFADVFVASIYVSFVVFMWVGQSGEKIVWPLYVACTLILMAASYHPWRNRRRKKEKKQLGDSLQGQLKKKSRQMDYQIRFSRWGSIWGYYLPTVIALGLFIWQMYLNGHIPLNEFQMGFLFFIVMLGSLGYFVGGMGIGSAKKQKSEIDLELEALGCSVTEEETPMIHRVARTILVVCTFAVCGYLLTAALAEKPRTRMPIEPAPTFDQLGLFGEQETRQIDEWLDEVREAGDYPGLMVAIVGDGKVLYQGAVGYADLKSQREATPETLWHVASVTKAFTGTLAAKLHEQSVIDLDRPVVDYLPESVSISESPQRGATITLRQLASHTSGLPRRVPDDVQSVEGRYELDPKRLYKQLANVELLFFPGTYEEYSNLGMGLLGHALERAAGIPFDQSMKDEILTPLGMTHSGISVADEDLHLLATGYGRDRPREFKNHSYQSRLAASGGLVTSVAELSKFLIAQMPENPQQNDVFTTAMLTNMHTPTQFKKATSADTALGWSVDESRSIGRYLEKNGGRNNASAWIGFSSEQRVGVAVIANCGDASVEEIGYWLLERAAPNADVAELNRRSEFAEVAPFTGVRWVSDSDQPTVKVRGDWMRLVSIDGVAVEHIMKVAREVHGDRARMRFSEDLVDVLSAAGLDPGWTVTLVLDRGDGAELITYEEEMTEENREPVRDARLEKLELAE